MKHFSPSVCISVRTRLPLASVAKAPLFLFIRQLHAMSTLPLPYVTDPTQCLPADSFDPAVFDKTIDLKGISVPAKNTSAAVKGLSPIAYQSVKVRGVIKDPADETRRIILLQESFAGLSELTELPEFAQKVASDLEGRLVTSQIYIGYKHLSTDEVLRQLIPPEIKHVTTSFELAGHLAHMNLTDDNIPYKYVIGRVMLDKNNFLRTVVNKTGKIDTTFRTFPMEVIAGDGDTNVTAKLLGAAFRFDFRHVYWNSRQQHEHEYIVKTAIPAGSVVADMFCGVGPFAIPLAMEPQRCTVYANDLNPTSIDALKINVRRNHVKEHVRCYNMDARDFMRQMVAEKVPFSHVLMNLPADAISFLDVFIGLYGTTAPAILPTIHTYCFSKADSFAVAKLDVMNRVLHVLGLTSPLEYKPDHPEDILLAAAAELSALVHTALPGFQIREIRDVAPKKIMCCAEFVLPASIACSDGEGVKADIKTVDEPEERAAKRPRTGSLS